MQLVLHNNHSNLSELRFSKSLRNLSTPTADASPPGPFWYCGRHFSYSLKFVSPKATNTFEGKVASIDEDFYSLYKAGKCFAIPHENFMAQFVDENRKFEYSLEIRNLKEEVKDENYESGISDDEEDSKE